MSNEICTIGRMPAIIGCAEAVGNVPSVRHPAHIASAAESGYTACLSPPEVGHDRGAKAAIDCTFIQKVVIVTATKKLPARSEVPAGDTWDLTGLFPSDAAWQRAFGRWEKRIGAYEAFRGRLNESAETLAACLKLDSELERVAERLGNYAFLRTAEDTSDGTYQEMLGRFQHAASTAAQAASFIRPEIMAIGRATMKKFLQDASLAPYRLLLERLLRYKPHTLGQKEENLLAMQSEMAQATSQAFRQLNNADLKFGMVRDHTGQQVELSHATFQTLLHSPQRSVRKKAFEQYYEQFDAHRYTLAATLSGSIQKDIYYARARGYASARDAALFPDNVPPVVYDSLIASVRKHLPALFRYFDLRRRKLRLKQIHHYDTYVPILSRMEVNYPWDKAVQTIVSALQPLGSQYCRVLQRGLSGRWCDRYPNRNKQSGAFSAGGYDGDPYILMNYEPTVLDQAFTLAHEAGHSMHSYFSAKHQPFEYYDYTIFVAEVASTFNEQLLSRHLLEHASSDEERAYIINHDIDAIRGTIIRQTMFAEFEKIAHEQAEAGHPLTVERFQEIYQKLLSDYFGPQFQLDPQLRLECFRIPHFYRAFYVYKYATGLSAAIALAHRVLEGGRAEREDYLNFLQGGCSKYPLDLLRDAGVDMEQPEPVDTALTHFEKLVDELESLL